MRIYLADLAYLRDDDYTHPVPLGVASIAAYCARAHPSTSFRIFKHPARLLEAIASEPPDLLALSHYCWNANLDLAVLREARRIHPNVQTVLGGPSFEDEDPAWIRAFFSARPEVDLYLTHEGESGFERLLALLARHGRIEQIPHEEWPATFVAFDHATDEIRANPNNPVSAVDPQDLPSPYLTGLLDEFLADEHLVPIIETNRGCPYACTFCCWGNAIKSKVRAYELETVLQELEYIAVRSRNPMRYLFIADANFGILQRDEQIADHLAALRATHGFPQNVFLYFAKNTNDRVISIGTVLRHMTPMSMSRQTMNDEVLEKIKRKNIPGSGYDRLVRECEERELLTSGELIYGLPGESFESFLDGYVAYAQTGQNVVTYPAFLIPGAEMSSRASRVEHGIQSASRVMPRYCGSFGDVHAVEYQELVVGTSCTTRDDFLRYGVFRFVNYLFLFPAFSELRLALRRAGSSYAALVREIMRDESSWSGPWGELLRWLRAEHDAELIDDNAVPIRFSREDVETVLRDRRLPHVAATARLLASRDTLASFSSCLERLVDAHGQSLRPACSTDVRRALQLSLDRLVCFEDLQPERTVSYPFEVQGAPPGVHRLRLTPGREEQFHRFRSATTSIWETVYRLRTEVRSSANVLSDDIFSYEREWAGPLDTVAHSPAGG